jgi:hypothetical protein
VTEEKRSIGDVAVDEDDPTPWHRVNPHLDDTDVGPRALGRILSADRFDEPAHFGFDIDLALLAVRCEVADVIG